jgi:ClpP class serine protease
MWLLEQKIRERMEAAPVLTAEQMAQALTFNRDQFGKLQAGADGTATIPIEGILTQQRDYMAMFFGGGNTLYPDITGAIAEANGDPSIKRIDLAVGRSPGGSMIGLFPVMEAVRTSEKPTRMIVAHEVASATYMIGSQTDEIVVSNKGVRVGSMGVVATAFVDESIKEITNRESPNKRPDLATPDGVAVVEDELDSVYALYAGAVAKGRGKTVSIVNKTFGRGSMLMASDALAVGMIDRIEAAPRVNKKSTATGGQQEARSMDLMELKQNHPEIYAQAVADGVAQERDRVCAHVILGQASGDIDTAVTAIKEGTEMTATLRATYEAAAMNRNAVEAREADNPEPEAVAPVEKPAPEAKDDNEISDELAEYMLGRNAEMEV